MEWGRQITAAAACLMLVPSAAIAAESCGANATETSRSESNGRVTLSCHCNDGYVQGAGGCIRASTPAGQSFKLGGLRTSGSVSVILPNGTRLTPADARSRALPAGTRIATADGGDATLTFPDGSTVHLGGNTIFAIETPRGPQGFVYRLAVGILDFAHTGKSRGRIRTPTVVLAVRGTAFALRSGAQGSSITLRSGLVDLLDRNGGVLLTLRAGQTVDVSANGAVGTPRPSA